MNHPNDQSPSLSIRPYNNQDFESLLRIFRDAIRVLGREQYDSLQTFAWSASADDPDSFRMRLARGFTLVAERNGQVIGFGQLNPADVVELLFCDPGHAHGGVGGRLLAALEALAIASGQIVIDTKASLVACDFFTKHGYQTLGQEVVTRNGVAIPRFAMRKMLVDPPCSRWAIIGNAGSGKTTLARKIAELSGAAVLDLDTVAWERNTSFPKRRSPSESHPCILDFCSSHARWIVEGCYEDLVAATFPFDPCLVWLGTGVDECMARCRTRDFEAQKFASPSEQNAALPALLDWVAAYPLRDGPMSQVAHRTLHEGFDGRKCETRASHRPSDPQSPDGPNP